LSLVVWVTVLVVLQAANINMTAMKINFLKTWFFDVVLQL
jgi:hypothetical protein